MTKFISGALIGVLVLGWLSLLVSGRGVLFWFTEPQEKVGMLKCQYFTGTGTVERQFLYTEQGLLGRAACPRFVDLTK